MGRVLPRPMQVYVDNAAGISFQKSTCASSKLGEMGMSTKVLSEFGSWQCHLDFHSTPHNFLPIHPSDKWLGALEG